MSNQLILGFFDGLHQGHKLLFNEANGAFDVLTFENIPNKNKNFLYDKLERVKQLKNIKAKQIYFLDLATHNMSGLEFCNYYLKQHLKAQQIIVGSDYVFGKDRQNVNFLKTHFHNVKIIKRIAISTTQIKQLLATNNLEQANSLLLEPYYRSGEVVHGQKLATSLGFPTANIILDEMLFSLNEGSYVVKVEWNQKQYNGVGFVGKSKSFANAKSFIEVYILNFDKNLYGEKIKIIFQKFIRSNQLFSNINDLKQAINNDINIAKMYFNVNLQ